MGPRVPPPGGYPGHHLGPPPPAKCLPGPESEPKGSDSWLPGGHLRPVPKVAGRRPGPEFQPQAKPVGLGLGCEFWHRGLPIARPKWSLLVTAQKPSPLGLASGLPLAERPPLLARTLRGPRAAQGSRVSDGYRFLRRVQIPPVGTDSSGGDRFGSVAWAPEGAHLLLTSPFLIGPGKPGPLIKGQPALGRKRPLNPSLKARASWVGHATVQAWLRGLRAPGQPGLSLYARAP